MRRVARNLVVLLAVVASPMVVLIAIGANGRTALHAALMEDEAPPAPDYAEAAAWAALPEKEDAADAALVPGTADQQATAPADVFFLHAGTNWTLYWNVPVDHWLPRLLVDGPLLEQWASTFNGCCRIYAPRFRQEAIAYPQGREAEHQASLEVAYADVRNAFRHYLAHLNQGRPFIIAGAQSGGRHALRLLIEEVSGKPPRKQLVAAYLAGARIDESTRLQLRDMPICNAPTQTGCINIWNAIGRQQWDTAEPRDGEACVNPLTWRAGDGHAARQLNLGTIEGRLFVGGPIAFDAGLVDAQCQRGRLWVTPPEERDFWSPEGPGDYHIQNYVFYFANIRENAIARVRAHESRSRPQISRIGTD
jgi:hypothetical protein